jgi:density-regulated protein
MSDTEVLLVRKEVIYCAKCGMPPEYCEYGPDFETHCAPWLSKNHKDLFDKLLALRGASAATTTAPKEADGKPPKPDRPRTIEERLVAFYEEYEKSKLDSIPGLLEKYAGKEDKLFLALTKKYGPEPHDPYYTESEEEDDDDDDDDEVAEGMEDLAVGDKKKRRGAGAKKSKEDATACKVVVQKRAQNKRRVLTVVMGMETVPDIKLKDVSKAFSKRFAGSSSVKDGAKGKEKEIIIQGDHVFDVAEMIVDKFGVPDTAVFVDCDGEVVPLR